jgi:hypothetical protein
MSTKKTVAGNPFLIIYTPLDWCLSIVPAVNVLNAAADACRWSCRQFREAIESETPFAIGPREFPGDATMLRTNAPTAATIEEMRVSQSANHVGGVHRLLDDKGACVLGVFSLGDGPISDAEIPLREASIEIGDVRYRAEAYISAKTIIKAGPNARMIITRTPAKDIKTLLKDL